MFDVSVCVCACLCVYLDCNAISRGQSQNCRPAVYTSFLDRFGCFFFILKGRFSSDGSLF